ncbi:hypothetical protein PFL603g_01581 [Pseudomonas fluorescens]|uniref:Uncharacterized protein n=1 Tax=Pseudomonas fluorescens TaxID=294 RepID=A0A109L1E0_PSEFL|nr:hypothetical protein PFL603g_01581 [Pseudomonas fluorescens]
MLGFIGRRHTVETGLDDNKCFRSACLLLM